MDGLKIEHISNNKVFKVDKNPLNIQKCLLPECEFAKKNFGRYCLAPSQDTGSKYLVKIGLYNKTCVDKAMFLDDSVCNFEAEPVSKPQCPLYLTVDDFTVLKEVAIAKEVIVVVAFNNILDVLKYSKSQILGGIVKDILEFYAFSCSSVVYLDSLYETQNFGLSCVVIKNVQPDNSEVYEIDSNTKIIIRECVSHLKLFKQNESLILSGGSYRVKSILEETVLLAKSLNNQVKFVNKILLIGPKGCGKRILVQNIVAKHNCVLLELSPSHINSLLPTELESKLKSVFDRAIAHSEIGDCCIVLITNIDMMSVGKSSLPAKFMGHLITFLEYVENKKRIVVIGTTNSPDKVDLQLRRAKRFEDELEISVPVEDERKEIIKNILEYCKLNLSEDIVDQISRWTPGFVGADLRMVIVEALMSIFKNQGFSASPCENSLVVNAFKQALTKVVPSALRGTIGLQTSKDTTFSQIGGLENIKRILDLSVKQQLQNPERFQKLGIPLTKGVLLYGPPGCAKTTLIKALAKECDTTFLATSAADLYSPYVGDAEKKIVQLFVQARIGSPSIVFIDEIDAVVGSKSGNRERGVQERILSALLVEMDGVGLKVNTSKDGFLNAINSEDVKNKTSKRANNGVIVIGATNRPQLLDSALKRPGRFDRLLYIPPPDEQERFLILKKLTENMPLDESVDLRHLAKVTEYFTGADLKGLCMESGLHALYVSNMRVECVHRTHFEYVLKNFKPSLNEKIVGFYESFQKYNT